MRREDAAKVGYHDRLLHIFIVFLGGIHGIRLHFGVFT